MNVRGQCTAKRRVAGSCDSPSLPKSRFSAVRLTSIERVAHYRSCVSLCTADNGRMHPNPPVGMWRSDTRDRRSRPPTFLASVLLGLTAVQFVAAQEQTAAVLKLHEVDFFYRSSVAPLSCSALEGRVMSVLHALGAREDIKVTVNNCHPVIAPQMPTDDWENPSDRWRTPSERWGSSSDRWPSSSERLRNRAAGREQSSHIRVRLMMPVEVTPEVLEELKRDKSRRELVSKVTGNPNASLDEPIVFPARRQNITLSRRTLDIEPEECELLEQMSTSVFRELGVRVVSGRPRCDRDRISNIPPQLTVEALMPIMPSVPQLSPPSGESETDPSQPEEKQ